MKISVVSTLYRSSQFIDEFYQRIKASIEQHTHDFELIFVDDGSPDDSNMRVQQLVKKDSRVMLVELSRNFGHHHAIMAGLSQAKGDLVFLIDSDLEEQPEWFNVFLEELREHNADVVYGIQRERVGGLFRKYTGNLFYRLFNSVSETKIPENPCTVRLMTKSYVKELIALKDNNLFLAGSFAWTGFRQKAISVDKLSLSEVGKKSSNYNLIGRTRLFINAVTSFSSYPLLIVFVIGLALSSFSGIFGIRMLFNRLLYPDAFQLGYSSIMISIWFLGGLIILFIGVIGLYLAKVFNEVKGRPQFIIRKIYKGE